mmetsp:Transcript_27740/g.82726  ORF Transcript_27740/g.82726 Transcript_27740/m.82726 type:complete len:299 (+) Transcript_27740:79-975(+)
MYIGAWQEFKLAKLIQQKTKDDQQVPSTGGTGRLSRASRRSDADDGASVASEANSRYSTQSAPAKLSAQSRLNDYYESLERDRQRRTGSSTTTTPSSGTRPRSSTGVRTGHAGTRGSSASSASSASGLPPRPKKKAAAKSKASLEQQRRERILHMQRLYGLAAEEEEEEEAQLPARDHSATLLPTTAGYGAAQSAASYAQADAGYTQQRGPTSEADRALVELNASMNACEPRQQESGHDMDSRRVESPLGRLPSLPEDPLNLSMSMGSSGGLIAWSKNLRADDSSPRATLSSFFIPSL